MHAGSDPQGLADVLLDEQHGQAGGQDLRQHAVDALDHHRRQAERQLVEQQHAGVGHERPADGHRLLLAAGQLRGLLLAALSHPAEQLVHALDRPRARPRVGGADLQVLLHRQRPEQPSSLRHHGDSPGGPAFGPQPGHVRAVEQDRARGRLVQAGDRAQQRRLARAVRADDRVDLAGEHPQRDPVQGPQLPVVHDQAADLQQRRPAACPAPVSRCGHGSLRSAPAPPGGTGGGASSDPGQRRGDLRHPVGDLIQRACEQPGPPAGDVHLDADAVHLPFHRRRADPRQGVSDRQRRWRRASARSAARPAARTSRALRCLRPGRSRRPCPWSRRASGPAAPPGRAPERPARSRPP